MTPDQRFAAMIGIALILVVALTTYKPYLSATFLGTGTSTGKSSSSGNTTLQVPLLPGNPAGPSIPIPLPFKVP